jgi:hypothetical protein
MGEHAQTWRRRQHGFPVGYGKAGAEGKKGGLLRVQILVDILVELLVGTGRLCSVEITSSRNAAIGRIEVERARYGVKVWDW